MRGTVDMGAYEFQGTNSMVFYSWVQHHGVVIDGTSDYEDPDGDGLNNWQEWVCYTCPTNMFKNLRLISAVPVGPHVVVRWESAAGVKYFVERSTSPTSPFTLVATDIVVNTGEAAYTNIFAAGPGPLYYRVGARAPTTQPAYLLCPVAAKPADPAYGLTYEGRAMTFCCADCKAVFQQAPTAYLTQIGLTPPSPEMAPPASTLFQFMMGSSDCTACDLGLRPPEPTPCPTPSPAETSSCCRPRSQPNPGE
jgi:YHS domain-containing protein